MQVGRSFRDKLNLLSIVGGAIQSQEHLPLHRNPSIVLTPDDLLHRLIVTAVELIGRQPILETGLLGKGLLQEGVDSEGLRTFLFLDGVALHLLFMGKGLHLDRGDIGWDG